MMQTVSVPRSISLLLSKGYEWVTPNLCQTPKTLVISLHKKFKMQHLGLFRKHNQPRKFEYPETLRNGGAGGEDGVVRIFDLRDGGEVGNFRAADDTVNGIEFHPYLPFAASASGAVYWD